jgi:hypothetical protein
MAPARFDIAPMNGLMLSPQHRAKLRRRSGVVLFSGELNERR